MSACGLDICDLCDAHAAYAAATGRLQTRFMNDPESEAYTAYKAAEKAFMAAQKEADIASWGRLLDFLPEESQLSLLNNRFFDVAGSNGGFHYRIFAGLFSDNVVRFAPDPADRQMSEVSRIYCLTLNSQAFQGGILLAQAVTLAVDEDRFRLTANNRFCTGTLHTLMRPAGVFVGRWAGGLPSNLAAAYEERNR